MAYSRREFLKIAGLSGAACVALAVGVPALQSAQETGEQQIERLATTCLECLAGCGVVAQLSQGRLVRLVGNPQHPVNRGGLCDQGQLALERLLRPQRILGPLEQLPRGSGKTRAIDWSAATGVVARTLRTYQPGEIAFLLGAYPDHLADLVHLISSAMGGFNILRFDMQAESEGRMTLVDAAQRLFGLAQIPYFDIPQSDLCLVFGAHFSESWLKPLTLQRSNPPRLVHISPYRAPDGVSVDEWLPLRPGCECLAAQALARLAARELGGAARDSLARLDLAAAAEACGVSLTRFQRLARRFVAAPRSVALPGGIALVGVNGLAAGEAILALNAVAGSLGRPGGVFFAPEPPLYPEFARRLNTLAEVAALVERMQAGQIRALFVHGVDPLGELPAALGFERALDKVECIVSFAASPNATSAQADYVFPDQAPFASWGYQRVVAGSDRMALSALQPLVAPPQDARSTVDVLLAALQALGGERAARLPFTTEVDFLQQSLSVLADQAGCHTASDQASFWSLWRQQGGWWKAGPTLMPAVSVMEPGRVFGSASLTPLAQEAGGELYLIPLSQGASGREDDWLEIHPRAARKMGLRDGERVRVVSQSGETEAVVRLSQGVDVRAIAMPHSRALTLLGKAQNEAGNQACVGEWIKIVRT